MPRMPQLCRSPTDRAPWPTSECGQALILDDASSADLRACSGDDDLAQVMDSEGQVC